MKQSLAGLWRFALGADHTTPPEAADTSSNNPNQWFQAQQAVAAEDYAYTQAGEDGLPQLLGRYGGVAWEAESGALTDYRRTQGTK